MIIADIISLLQQMIRINTVNGPGNEKDLALYLEKIFSSNGFSPIIQNMGENRANFIVDIGNDQGPLLIFNGHLDVVPAVGDWLYPPFEGFSDGKKVYGRGAADMKGGLASMIAAFIQLAPIAHRFKGRLRLLFVADEESYNKGFYYYLANMPEARNPSVFAIIGEPTGLRICRGHLGVERYWIHFHGKGAHSSRPEEGVNAIGMATKFFIAMEDYHKVLRTNESFFGSPSCTVTLIEGGEKMNCVPAECKIMIDRRTIPGETSENVFKEIHELINDVFGRLKHMVEIEPYFTMPPGELSEENDLVKIAFAAQKQCGIAPVISGFDAGCEQGLMIKEGIPSLICGPGSIKMGHVPNEFIEIDQLEKATEFYKVFAENFLL